MYYFISNLDICPYVTDIFCESTNNYNMYIIEMCRGLALPLNGCLKYGTGYSKRNRT